MKITRRNLLAASAAFAVTPALAQPAKNMTLVVPFPPGGSTDALARLLQSHLQTKLGRTVLVENKSGAAGSLGAIQVAKSAPDGATFLVTFDSHAVIPSILEKPGLDVEKDLVPVFLVGTAPYVLAANAERPYKTFADVIAACKANPGAVKYASVGIGTLGHLAMTVLGKKAGVEITHVPYRGGGPAMNDVLGGHVDMIIGIGGAGHGATRHQHAASRSCKWGASGCPCSRTRRPRSRQAIPISRRWPGGAFSRQRTRRPMSSPAWRNR